MRAAKIFFAWAIGLAFVALNVFGACALMGIGKATNPNAAPAAFIASWVGAIVAALNAKHLFDDPEAVTKLKEKHHEEVLKLKDEIATAARAQADKVHGLDRAHSEKVAALQKEKSEAAKTHASEVAKLTQESGVNELKAQHLATQVQATHQQAVAKLMKENGDLRTQVAALRPRPHRVSPAPGSIGTST